MSNKQINPKTNGPDTKNDKWGCAKVASIILQKAGIKMEVERGVSAVESSLDLLRKSSKVTLRQAQGVPIG